MKKVLALAIALLLAFSLAACGKKENGGASGTNDTPNNQGTGDNSSNNGGAWSDTDSHTATFSEEGDNGEIIEYTVTIWNPKLLDKDTAHPASANQTIVLEESTMDYMYIPYTITIRNIGDVKIRYMGNTLKGASGVTLYSFRDDSNTVDSLNGSATFGIEQKEPGYERVRVGYATILDVDYPPMGSMLSFGSVLGFDFENPGDPNPKIWTNLQGNNRVYVN